VAYEKVKPTYEILLYSYKKDNVVKCNIETRSRKERCGEKR